MRKQLPRHLIPGTTQQSRHFPDYDKRRFDDALQWAEITQQHHGTPISQDVANKLVQECTKQRSLEMGRRVQALIIHGDVDTNGLLTAHLIRLFASCGSLYEALHAFNQVPKPSQYAWNAIMDAHAKLPNGGFVLQLYDRMQYEGIQPGKFTFPSILKTCGSIGAIEIGRHVHDQILENGLQPDLVVDSSLVNMYTKCKSLQETYKTFQKLTYRNVVTWSALITGYAQHGEGALAMRYYESMQQEGIQPDKFIFSNILSACGSIGSIFQSRCIHEQIIRDEVQYDIVLGNGLVDMYSKCGSLEEAWMVFEGMPNRNLVTWGTMIAGYAQHDEGVVALECYEYMQHEGIQPNKEIFSSILKACGSIGAIGQGWRIHEELNKSGLQSDIVLANTLVDMYARCGNLEEASRIFATMLNRDISSWGAMIAGYAQVGEARLALQVFEDMQHSGIRSDHIAFNGILTGFNRAGLMDEGLWYFKNMSQYHGIKPNLLHITALVDLLGRAGYFKDAEDLLKTTSQRDICLWKTLFSTCKLQGNVELGRRCFDEILLLDFTSSGAYCLMSSIYATHKGENFYEADTLKGHVERPLITAC